MKLLGIRIKHPSFTELCLLALYIIFIAGLAAALHGLGFLPAHSVPLLVYSASLGAVLAAFGVSIVTGGWRAKVIVVLASTLCWAALTLLGVL